MTSSDVGRTFKVKEIGIIKNDFKDEIPEDYRDKTSHIKIYPEFEEALLGIEGNSHLAVLCWFDRSDRKVKRVHPFGDESNPITGVFATRAPVRPNPIAETICELEKREENELYVKGLDAFDDTPVIDIKPYTSNYLVEEVKYPEWVPDKEERRGKR